MRHARLALALCPAIAGLGVAAPPSPAQAQAQGMDCFNLQGGRAVCTSSRDALYDRIDRQVRANREAETRERKLVKAVAQAVHDGHCEEALALALKSENPMVAANTARLCGVPEAPAPTGRDG